MPAGSKRGRGERRTTRTVSEDLFREVYDSPRSLPGKQRWVTSDKDVQEIERLLGLEANTIGAPLWVSGDTRNCRNCGREINWLDIVASGLRGVHRVEMIAKVILGKAKFVNVEAPRAIADLRCYGCGAEVRDLRSFKCHNWAYAIGDLRRVVDAATRPA
jgi:hypothetical protein